MRSGDAGRSELFAARDRFGIKPLFYAVDGDNIYLASEVKAIFAAGLRPSWDYESVYQHLYFSVDQDRSLFGGVAKSRPAIFKDQGRSCHPKTLLGRRISA
ncbi:MAG: hypothetical protein IPP63_11715 [Chloracidobacterium sp.]|nr:hypothetical protein [Chloracidobacterium sp.]